MEDIIICIFLYAHDIALLAENEDDRQQLIIRVANWLTMNLDKTKILCILALGNLGVFITNHLPYYITL